MGDGKQNKIDALEVLNKDVELHTSKLNEIIAVLQENGLTRKIEVDFIYPEGEKEEEEEESEAEGEVEDDEEIVE